MIKNNISLKPINSFAIDVSARKVVTITNEMDFLKFQQYNNENIIPYLILGDGSNVLFLENYIGTVILNRISGMYINEVANTWRLHIGAGEIWHNLVVTCLKKRIPGLENLALIPGRVGSAPVQNIGAYGVELQQLCEYVDIIELKSGIKKRLSAIECKFGYRDSIFKHDLRGKCIITAVGLKLSKTWHPVLQYSNLSKLHNNYVTPKQVYNTICNIRHKLIPNPALVGNSGSFFKNPIIEISLAKTLLYCYPNLPYFPQKDGKIKISAGWLIEHCGLKGYRLGSVAVHKKQALVLLNINNATGMDIIKLARYIYQRVAERFNILLEPEVCFISAYGEVDAVKLLHE